MMEFSQQMKRQAGKSLMQIDKAIAHANGGQCERVLLECCGVAVVDAHASVIKAQCLVKEIACTEIPINADDGGNTYTRIFAVGSTGSAITLVDSRKDVMAY